MRPAPPPEGDQEQENSSHDAVPHENGGETDRVMYKQEMYTHTHMTGTDGSGEETTEVH